MTLAESSGERDRLEAEEVEVGSFFSNHAHMTWQRCHFLSLSLLLRWGTMETEINVFPLCLQPRATKGSVLKAESFRI